MRWPCNRKSQMYRPKQACQIQIYGKPIYTSTELRFVNTARQWRVIGADKFFAIRLNSNQQMLFELK